jgi:hypothetical protein
VSGYGDGYWAPGADAELARRFRRQQEWDEQHRAAPQAAVREPPPMAPYPQALDGAPGGGDPEELLREIGDPDAIRRWLDANVIPGRPSSPAREQARRREARRLTEARSAMEAALPRTAEARSLMRELGIGGVGHEPGARP